VFANEFQIFLVQMLLLARSLVLLVPSAPPAFLDLFIFVDDETFADLVSQF
jgi:hypothetical protein